MRSIGLAALLAALLLLPAAALAKPASPAVKGVSAASAWSHPGGSVRVTAKLSGKVPKAARVRFTVGPAAATGKARKGIASAAVRLPKTLAAGSYGLRACLRSRCRRATRHVTVTAEPRGSDSLIADALAAGRITPDQAVAYRAFAAFGSPDLPAAYRGDGSVVPDDSFVRELQGRWATLPAALRAKLLPYLRPPAVGGAPGHPKAAADEEPTDDHCDGAWRVKGKWTSALSPHGHVRIWWELSNPQDASSARGALADLDTAYEKFKALTGRDIPSDVDAACDHGTGGELDIYLIGHVHTPNGRRARALTLANPDAQGDFPCGSTSSFVLFDQTLGVSRRWELAHELFHAFQNGYAYAGNCADYAWMDEGTATWAANYAFPDDDEEHRFYGLIEGQHSLFEESYESWPFDLYLEKVHGAKSIADIYEAYGSNPGPASSIDAALPGGLRKIWPEFTRYAWNQAPVEPSFTAWDRWDERPEQGQEDNHLFLAGGHTRTAQVPMTVYDLGRFYKRYSVTDDNIRKITFNNTLASNPDAGVQALLTLRDGTQRIEDWSGRGKVELCRDDAHEDVTGIVLMVSNASHADDATLRPDPVPTFDLKDSCDEFPYHYKVVAASISTHTVGTNMLGSGVCSSNGFAVEGDTDYTGDVGEQPLDSGDSISHVPLVGKLTGRIAAHVPAGFDRVVKGCQLDQSGQPSLCQHTLPHEDTNGWDVGFSVDAAGPDAGDATIQWQVPPAQAGGSGGDTNSFCNAFAAFAQVPPDEAKQTVPLSKLASKSEQTFELNGTRVFPSQIPGSSQSLSYTYALSLTVVRVVDP